MARQGGSDPETDSLVKQFREDLLKHLAPVRMLVPEATVGEDGGSPRFEHYIRSAG